MSFKHISTSVVVCSKIIYLRNSTFSQYFSHIEVLIIKVYHQNGWIGDFLAAMALVYVGEGRGQYPLVA